MGFAYVPIHKLISQAYNVKTSMAGEFFEKLYRGKSDGNRQIYH